MFFKYRINSTDEIFYYSNEDNSLYDSSFNRITELGEDMSPTCSTKKSNRPIRLRISIGKKCNYTCSYCMQNALSEKQDVLASNESADDFIHDIEQLDLSLLERVELWGGEPFLYFDFMKKILSSSINKDGITWFISTNGTIFKEEHLDFMDTVPGKITFGISHDGPKHEEIRGKCFLEKILPVLHRMDKNPQHYGYSFQVSLSHKNCDVFDIQNFFVDYMEKHGLKHGAVSYQVIEAYDLLSYSSTIHGESLTTLEKSIKKLLNKNILDFKKNTSTTNKWSKHNLFSIGDESVLKTCKSFSEIKTIGFQTKCGALWEHLIAIDLQGNILSCPHVDATNFKCGNIKDLSDVNIKYMDRHAKRRDDRCLKCPVMLSCMYGCPLDKPDEYHQRSCDALFSFYLSIQLAAFKFLFNSDITYLGAEDKK